MKGLLNFPVMMFVKDVFFRIVPTTVVAISLPVVVLLKMEQGILRLVVCCVVCSISTVASAVLIGMTKQERKSIMNSVLKKIKG